jgi:hypothetical protein
LVIFGSGRSIVVFEGVSRITAIPTATITAAIKITRIEVRLIILRI